MKVAVIGSGISGLVAARELARTCEVALFEAGAHAGGHTHTHDLVIAGELVRVDTGFIVFNERTYPGFCALLRELGVVSQPSDMGLSVSCERSGLEYNGRNLDTVFAQRSNLFSPAFLGLLREILRFHRRAAELARAPADPEHELELGAWLDTHSFSRAFRERYLVPMTGAVWSASADDVARFPARFLARFLHNHGMLQVDDRPQWRTVSGGSRRYVDALLRAFPGRVHLNTPVARIERAVDHAALVFASGERREFDAVVLATHSDTALALLAEPTRAEREVLGAIRYQTNDAVLHTDARLMPRRRKCWASWNCHLAAAADAHAPVAVTYWMNQLQSLPTEAQLFVTLNQSSAIDPERVLRTLRYAHPRFTLEALRAQARRAEIQGTRRTWYCGAYWGFGFHEDGLQSGLAAARELSCAHLEVHA